MSWLVHGQPLEAIPRRGNFGGSFCSRSKVPHVLTETAIRNAKVPTKLIKLSDERGLYLLCAPNGGKWWRFNYRYAGQEKLLLLGTYPETSLAKARERREQARRQLAAGMDPSVARREAKRRKVEATANNFEGVAREWLETVKPGWAAIYHGDTVKRFEAFVFLAKARGRKLGSPIAAGMVAIVRAARSAYAAKATRRRWLSFGKLRRVALVL